MIFPYSKSYGEERILDFCPIANTAYQTLGTTIIFISQRDSSELRYHTNVETILLNQPHTHLSLTFCFSKWPTRLFENSQAGAEINYSPTLFPFSCWLEEH